MITFFKISCRDFLLLWTECTYTMPLLNLQKIPKRIILITVVAIKSFKYCFSHGKYLLVTIIWSITAERFSLLDKDRVLSMLRIFY